MQHRLNSGDEDDAGDYDEDTEDGDEDEYEDGEEDGEGNMIMAMAERQILIT